MTAPYVPNLPMIALPEPSKPKGAGLNTGGQAKRRYQDTFFDVHRNPRRFPQGRPWTGPRELAAMPDAVPKQPDPFCGPDLQQGEHVVNEFGQEDRAATFASTWHAPWVPVKKYFRFVYERKLIRFDYNAMFVEEKQGLTDYYKAAAKVGSKLNIRVNPGQVPDWQITQVLGDPSRMVYIAQAAIANDPWLLGFVDEPNAMLAEILGFSDTGLKLPEYVAPAAVMTPSEVLATPDTKLMAMIEMLSAQVKALQDEKADAVRKKAEQSAAIKAGQAAAKAKKAAA